MRTKQLGLGALVLVRAERTAPSWSAVVAEPEPLAV
jgi:hypothetical protein